MRPALPVLAAALLPWAVPAPARAQAGAEPVALPHEGETIASVRLDAPGVDLQRFGRYLEIRPGQRLRAADLRHIVELLHATGEFEDVVVDGTPGPQGLDLVIRPVPAPLLGGVRIAGDPVVDAAEVARVARLEAREPLWPARLEAIARDVAVHLAAEGYLEARVAAAGVRGPAGTDAVVTIQAGPRVLVSSLDVEGIERYAQHLLRPLLRPLPGEPFRRAQADAAAEKLRRELVRRGHWHAVVEVHTAYDPRAARTALRFVAAPGPGYRVAFRGDRPPAGLRQRVESLLREGRARTDALEEAVDRLEAEFRRRGHRDVVVSRAERSHPGGSELVFDVHAGPQARVAWVSLAGAPAALLRGVATRPDTPLQERVLDEDVRTLTRTLEDDGYPAAKVEVEAREGGGLVPVVFHAQPGARVVVASYTVAAPELDGQAGRELHLRPGALYRARDLALDRNDLLAAYRDAGFLSADVRADVRVAGDGAHAHATLTAIPGPRTRVDHVVIAGLDHTDEQVVRRELRLQEGQPLGITALLETQRRLGALGLFRRVSVAEMDPESLGARSVVVAVQEAPRTTFVYGVGYAAHDKLRGSVEVSRRNLFGLDRSLSTFLRASRRGTRVFTTYREPYLFGRKQDLFFTGFREEEDRDAFDFIRFGGSLQTARSFESHWSVVLRYTYQKTRVFRLEVPEDDLERQFRNTTFSGPSVSILADTRDDPLDPRRGRFAGADLQFSSDALGGNGFIKSFLQLSTYERVSRRATLALNARLGLGKTLGRGVPERLPAPDRFFAGGDYTLRGFKTDFAGPLELSSLGELVPTGGNALLTGGAELRVDVGRYLSMATFGELGNVYRLASDLSLEDLRYTAGLGLRYRSALGPLRVDWGYNLSRRRLVTGKREKPSELHITLGHAF